MSAATDKVIDSFVSKVKAHGVPIREENNDLRLGLFEEKLPNRLPESFESFLSRYSFPAFDVVGISLFAWESDSNVYSEEASAAKGSLSELLLPAGYVQIGRPDTGDFDAVCFDLNEKRQNREYRIVQVDHEDILCNWKVQVSAELWPSFIKLVDRVLSSANPEVCYEDPIV
jgi:SMI1/KNR4 family protein SUKH-1